MNRLNLPVETTDVTSNTNVVKVISEDLNIFLPYIPYHTGFKCHKHSHTAIQLLSKQTNPFFIISKSVTKTYITQFLHTYPILDKFQFSFNHRQTGIISIKH